MFFFCLFVFFFFFFFFFSSRRRHTRCSRDWSSDVCSSDLEDGFQLRIVPLFPSDEKRALIEQLVGEGAFLSEPEGEGSVRAPGRRSKIGRASCRERV